MNRSAKIPGPARGAIGATIASGALTAFAGAPAKLGALLHRRYPSVAVTGMTGVGKTRLADRLARRVSDAGTTDVGSAVMERRTRSSARGRGFRFRVVPGDNAATRLGALDEVFHDEPVDGVLHVVAYGHATPRRAGGNTGTATATEPYRARRLELTGVGTGPAGRRSPALTPRGRVVGTHPAGHEPAGSPVHLTATLRASAARRREAAYRSAGLSSPGLCESS